MTQSMARPRAPPSFSPAVTRTPRTTTSSGAGTRTGSVPVSVSLNPAPKLTAGRCLGVESQSPASGDLLGMTTTNNAEWITPK